MGESPYFVKQQTQACKITKEETLSKLPSYGFCEIFKRIMTSFFLDVAIKHWGVFWRHLRKKTLEELHS